jgi:ribonuclease HI
MKSCVAYIDGGSRGNPGVSGYGVVVFDEYRNSLAEISEFLGIQTNNYAEYSALIGALRYATTHQYDGLRVYADSELLVRQIKGEYKVRNENLKRLFDQAQSLIHRLKQFSIQHIPREENQDADQLANMAMNRAGSQTTEASLQISTVRAVFRSGCFHPLSPLDLPNGAEFQLTVVPTKKPLKQD